MKVLIDECVPSPLARLLAGHECRTTEQCGWKGLLNGKLLKVAEPEFDVFVTSDQNIRYQQNLTGFQISVVELSTNDYRRLRAAVDQILTALDEIEPGSVVRIEVPKL